MMAERGRDVARSGKISTQKENRNAGKSRAAGNYRKNASSTADPLTSLSHRRAEQQGQRRIARHRIVFLRRGKREEHQDKPDPANRQQTDAPRAVDRFKRKLGDSGEVDAPWKKPQKVEEPEPNPGDRIVIARITQIEETKDLFVNEIEPEKAMVCAGPTVKRERKIRRIVTRR